MIFTEVQIDIFVFVHILSIVNEYITRLGNNNCR